MTRAASLKLPLGLAKNVTIAALARKVAHTLGPDSGVTYRKVHYRIMRMYAQDLLASGGRCEWATRLPGQRTAIRINMSKFRKAHPEWCEEVPTAELSDRLDEYESKLQDERFERESFANAVVETMREVRSEVRSLRAQVDRLTTKQA